MTAVYCNHRTSVIKLITLGCDVNKQLFTPEGRPKNQYVSSYRRQISWNQMVDFFFWSPISQEGYTALMISVAQGLHYITTDLVAIGKASIKVSYRGKSAIEIAKNKGYTHLADYLMRAIENPLAPTEHEQIARKSSFTRPNSTTRSLRKIPSSYRPPEDYVPHEEESSATVPYVTENCDPDQIGEVHVSDKSYHEVDAQHQQLQGNFEKEHQQAELDRKKEEKYYFGTTMDEYDDDTDDEKERRQDDHEQVEYVTN